MNNPLQRSLRPLLVIFGALVLVGLFITFLDYLRSPDSLKEVVVRGLLLMSVLVALIINWVRTDVRFSGMFGVYSIYFFVTHAGFLVGQLFAGEAIDTYPRAIIRWCYTDESVKAAAVSGIAIISLMVGSLVPNFLLRVDPKTSDHVSLKLPNNNRGIVVVGNALLFIAGLLLAVAAIRGDLKFFGTYTEFREGSTSLATYGVALWALATGAAFIAGAGSPRERTVGGILFAIMAVPLIASGNRGEVLFPLAACLGVLVRRGMCLDLKLVVTTFVLLFLVIPFIKQTRQVEKEQISLTALRFSWADPFVEMGMQLRTVTTTIGWIEGGEPYANGATYVIPFTRTVWRMLPVFERPEYEGTRFHLSARLRRWGYSPVAEAYFNFGLIGVITIPFVLGLGITWFERSAVRLDHLALGTALLVVLIVNVRNNFMFVPGQCAGVLTAYGLAKLITICSMKKQ